MRRLVLLCTLLALTAWACGGNDAAPGSTASPTTAATSTTGVDATTTTGAPATTAPAETTTTAAVTTTTAADGAIVDTGGGSYTIDWGNLASTPFFAPPAAGSDDPFFHVHTDPATDGFFLSVEAYTTGYGATWTGELGNAVIDCSPGGSGICVHFDPDGPGPIGNLGADFATTGEIEILQADADGFVAVLVNVTFSDGSTIPGPLTVSG